MLFAEISGQPKAVRLLSRALETGRLAHAYLFRGPDGVGKTTTARSMAAMLTCVSSSLPAPCGRCPGCIKFASGSHPDFLHITPQGATIKIDQVRELKKALSFPPLESNQRVILLEDVHTMRREAGNSLLKILEEPPPQNVLLLTADESEPLLPTIASRCQIVPFYPLPAPLTADIIMRTRPGLDRKNALTLAALAEGCPGNAQTLDADGLLKTRKEIIETLLMERTIQADEVEAALSIAGKTAELKDSLPSLLNLLRTFFKDAIIDHCAPSRNKDDDPELIMEITRARERWNLAQLSDKVEAVDYADRALARNCSRALVCEVLFLTLIQTGKFRQLERPV